MVDSLDIEEKFNGSVVLNPEEASFIVDSVNGEILRFSSWSETADSYHFSVKNREMVVTIRKYLHPSNRYYLVKNDDLDDMV